MRKIKRLAAILLSLALLMTLCACGEKPKTITVDNETGYAISDLRMSAVYSGEWGPNRLEEMLYDTESAVIALGDYTDGELEAGYSIQLFDDYDNSFAAADGILVEPGDTLTLFMPDGLLAWSLDGSFTVDDSQEDEPAEGSESDWNSTQPDAWETEEYLDEDTGLRMSYPSNMSAWSQDGAIFVAGSGCGVTVRDVEATYNSYSGYDGDFLYEMQTNCLMEDFEEIFGDGTEVYFSSGEQDDRFSWSYAEFHVDINNDSTHVDAFGLLFADDTGRTVYKCFYAPYGDDAAMEYLLQNVRNYGPAGDPGGAPDPDDPIYANGAHELAGIWYVDGDYSNGFFVIDANGGWEYYSRTSGDPEGELLDYGYTESDGDSRYVLFSDTEDASYELFWFDTDILTFSDDYGETISLARMQ